ncbi:MAG: hypothetical protein QOJ59_1312 [Thermomicrobiales bacterium]|jgi:adenylate cyclase class IV|nr:hypothetical protein [Thermomicrobiales bacterium]
MARNLELKVRCPPGDLSIVRERAQQFGVSPFVHLRQVDTYFAVAHGRLKLREISPSEGARSAELIAYARPDQAGPRWSSYRRVPVPAADASELRAALAETVGVAAVVTKTRDVAILGRTRIHLDSVAGLGEFVELETVIEGQDEGDAAEELAEVADALGLGAYERIAGSYGDLVERREGGV